MHINVNAQVAAMAQWSKQKKTGGPGFAPRWLQATYTLSRKKPGVTHIMAYNEVQSTIEYAYQHSYACKYGFVFEQIWPYFETKSENQKSETSELLGKKISYTPV